MCSEAQELDQLLMDGEEGQARELMGTPSHPQDYQEERAVFQAFAVGGPDRSGTVGIWP